ncbi:MAG: hypothetical protein M1835_000340 [Candelina submexicana]|nr:MAG: hypothetical protein M1835_000340 [Candelina submexicana]
MLRFPITHGSASPRTSRTGRIPTPTRALYTDLSSAYTSITAGSTSAHHDRDAETSPGPTISVEHWRNEAPLPPSPAVIRRTSETVAPVQEGQTVSGYCSPVIHMPARPPSWKQKLSSVFHRNIDNRSLCTLLPTVEPSNGASSNRGISDYTSADRNHVAYPDAASQSALILGEASRLSLFTRRASSHYDDSFIHHERLSGSYYAPSIDGVATIPHRYADDLAVEYSVDGPYSQSIAGGKLRSNCRARADKELPPTANEDSLTRNNTDESLLGSYGADRGTSSRSMCFEDVQADAIKAQSLPTKAGALEEASLPSSTVSKATNPSVSNDFEALIEVIPDDTATAHTNLFGYNNPPTGPLPARPHAVASPRSLGRDRGESTQMNGISQGSSYGDTRDLLNISTVLPSLQPRYRTASGPNNNAMPPLLRAFSTNSSKSNDNSGPQNGSSGCEKHASPITDNQSRAESMNGSRTIALERQISKELRRISHLSGLSNLSGNVVVLDEDVSRNGSLEDKGLVDLGPGGSQSSSSHERMNQIMAFNSGSMSDGRSAGASLYRYNQLPDLGRHGPAIDRMDLEAKGSLASFMPMTESSVSSREADLTEEYRGDEDLDWVTEADSRAFSKYDTEDNLPLGMTGSSLADYSSHGSLISHSRQASQMAPLKETIQHPADKRYEHVYRLRQFSETGQSLRLPDYSYPSGSGFPNRNALTTPIFASSSINNPYQHPAPLTKEHAHPFNSSPPPLSSEKNFSYPHIINRRAIDAVLQDAKNTDSKHNMVAAQMSEASEESLVDSLRRYKPDRTPILSFAPSLCLDEGIDAFRPSSTWVSTNDDDTADAGPFDTLDGSTGSFSKITTLGPAGNLTGSPQGTGMREVGSSLANGSSPGMIWSSSPPQPTSSPLVDARKSFNDTITSEKVGQSVKDSVHNHAQCKLSAMCENVCSHGQHIRTNGILQRAPMNLETAEAGLASVSLSSPQRSPGHLGNSGATVASTASYNEASLLPQLERKEARVTVPFAARLHRLPRPASSIATTSRQRKKALSRTVLGLCLLFPPLLIIYGHGYMDSIMVQITDGQVEHFGRKEKQLACCLGWSLAVSAVVGLVIGMIVIAMIRK